MTEVTQDIRSSTTILLAARKVLQDPSFRRAPVMSHLLEYLVGRTFDDEPIKSYTIATEALGRAPDDGAEADTYARVAVARLRKALINYYADHPDEDEVYIDTGSYTVMIRSRSDPASSGSADADQPGSVGRRIVRAIFRHEVGAVLAGLFVILVVIALGIHDRRESRQRWTQDNFPTVMMVNVGKSEDAKPSSTELDGFGNVLRAFLTDYFGFRLVESDELSADYEIRIDADRSGGAEVQTVTLLDAATSRIVWTRHYPISSEREMLLSAQQAAVAIAAPGGALNNHGRRKEIDSDTPYGCWLRFTGSVMSYSSRSDEELLQCAEAWQRFDNASRTAAFLRNWTLVDASITTLGEGRRRAKLQEALSIVHRALASNPENGMLYIGEMRTYSFLGMHDEVRQAARSAIEAAPDNRVITGLAGTWLTFWNEAEGIQILSHLDTESDTRLPWEHAGHFVSAMMEDDVEAAGRQLAFLRVYMEDQPALLLLEAAYLRRIGHKQQAEEALDKIRNHPRALIAGPDEILHRMPLSPVVKARIRQWLAYESGPVASQPLTEAER